MVSIKVLCFVWGTCYKWKFDCKCVSAAKLQKGHVLLCLLKCWVNDTRSHSWLTLINLVISKLHVLMQSAKARLGSDTCFQAASPHICGAICIYMTGLIWLLQRVPRLMITRISARPVSLSFGCDCSQSRMCYLLTYLALHTLSIRVCLIVDWGLWLHPVSRCMVRINMILSGFISHT